MAKKFKREEVIGGVIDFIKETTHDNLLPEVASELSSIVKEGDKVKIATIVSFFSLTEVQKEQIRKKLETAAGLEISLREIIDKSLLGGFKIKLGDWIYDASLKGSLEKLKNDLYANI